MNVSEAERREIGALFDDSLREAELALENWFAGRVPASDENRARFDDMHESSVIVCELLDQFPEITDRVHAERFRRLREGLDAIRQVHLAQDKINEVARALEALVEKERAR